ncbi:MAG: hypothetical protein NVSMB56_03160 [Pyrinomonadaceae bacterium]
MSFQFAAQKEEFMEKKQYAIGDRVEKMCVTCQEERGHVVATVNKRGLATHVECPKCGKRSTYKEAGATTKRPSTKISIPYEWTRTYRTGQTILHPTYGVGEVTALIEPRKIDVLFTDRMRRLVHAHLQA